MAFASIIKGLVSGAMQTVGDLAPTVTYRSITPGTYNVATGQVTEVIQDFQVKGVTAKFSLEEKDSSVIVTTDQKILIAAADLPVKPNPNDRVVIGSKTWNVIRLMGVPGESLHIIHIREV